METAQGGLAGLRREYSFELDTKLKLAAEHSIATSDALTEDLLREDANFGHLSDAEADTADADMEPHIAAEQAEADFRALLHRLSVLSATSQADSRAAESVQR